ncbi:NUDIX domain-containing protein [Caenibacillus caldisaponilyticus]|uniref:NUDIX domain-containing protein n=1 Tax=Caenibacillus caldisaponilyticus TaxID=1674942 RepID=UPI00098856A3|nr:NUDIX domain-containing protein [Caenibacillus caldisaponilyticus]
MFYRKKTYEIDPDRLEMFNDFFHQYLLPNQLKHGAELVGRWTTEDRRKIHAIWAYKSREDYERIERRVRHDELHARAQKRRAQLPPFFHSSREEFLTATGDYHRPKHIVSAAGVITNDEGHLLLVKTFWRADTWELPGGQIELGEALENAVKREIFEESGIVVAVDGLTGVYKNLKKDILTLVFRGRQVGGRLRISEETQDVGFFPNDPHVLDQLVTRPHLRARIRDAFERPPIPAISFHPSSP